MDLKKAVAFVGPCLFLFSPSFPKKRCEQNDTCMCTDACSGVRNETVLPRQQNELGPRRSRHAYMFARMRVRRHRKRIPPNLLLKFYPQDRKRYWLTYILCATEHILFACKTHMHAYACPICILYAYTCLTKAISAYVCMQISVSELEHFSLLCHIAPPNAKSLNNVDE